MALTGYCLAARQLYYWPSLAQLGEQGRLLRFLPEQKKPVASNGGWQCCWRPG